MQMLPQQPDVSSVAGTWSYPGSRHTAFRALRRIILTGYSVALAAVVVCAIYVIFFTNHVFVTTPSMYPTIPPGSLVFIHKEPRYRVGDVIEFHGNGLEFMHRIIKIGANGDITTKGDNPQNAPDYFDPPTTASDVIGKTVLSLKWAGFPELIARHPAYGLSWLRAELGLRGRLSVLLLSAVFFFASIADHRQTNAAPGE
jgi:signal peptidase I